MHTIQSRERTGRDGTLSLRIPLGQPDTEFEVVVVVAPKSSAEKHRPPGYFDLLASIDDETFIVHPQAPMPPPLEVE
jgi:hypothetical protein